MRTIRACAAGVSFLLLTSSSASAQVQLSLRDGRVTVVARNATVRQILAEWARIGQTKIVNAERIAGGPLTLELTNVAEQEALDLLLRSVTGYLAAPRPVAVANLSRYDRILVLATAPPPRPAASTAAPVFQQPPVQPRFEELENADDDGPSIVQPARGPLFPTNNQPPVGSAQPGGRAATPGMVQTPVVIEDQDGVVTTPNAGGPGTGPGAFMPPQGGAIGTPRPGMVVQPPVQPDAPGFPGQQSAPQPDN